MSIELPRISSQNDYDISRYIAVAAIGGTALAVISYCALQAIGTSPLTAGSIAGFVATTAAAIGLSIGVTSVVAAGAAALGTLIATAFLVFLAVQFIEAFTNR